MNPAHLARGRKAGASNKLRQTGWVWTDGLLDLVKRVYIDEVKTRYEACDQVNAALKAAGLPATCTPTTITNKAYQQGWRRSGWVGGPLDAEKTEQIRALYVDQLLTPAQIVERLGGECSRGRINGLVRRKGWAKLIPAVELSRRQSVGGSAGAASRWGERPKREVKPKPLPALGEGRSVPVAIRAAIDAAIAAGKVTVLPSGTAAGLSQVERELWAASPDPSLVSFNNRRHDGRGSAASAKKRELEKKAS